MQQVRWIQFVVIVILLTAQGGAGAGAQEADAETRAAAPPQERLTTHLALARICASEVGLRGSYEECAAIVAVLRDRAARNGWTLLGAARRYSTNVFNRERTDDRAWVAHLTPDGRQPAGWPTSVVVHRGGREVVRRHLPWSAYRDSWLRLYAAVRQILRGEIQPDCAQPPHHWGCRTCGDSERALSHGWGEVACWVAAPCNPDDPLQSSYGIGPDGQCRAPSLNAFWIAPRRMGLLPLRSADERAETGR